MRVQLRSMFLLITVLLMSKSLLFSNNNTLLNEWNQMSLEFDKTLQMQEESLLKLSQQLEQAENNGMQLTNSLEQLLQQNKDLQIFNDQIGQRMQERDIDLMHAYDDIEKLETRTRHLMLVILSLGVIVLFIILIKR